MQHFIVRFTRLILGLFLCALGVAITVRAHIGYAPWDVFHSGLGHVLGLGIGGASIVVSIIVGVMAMALGEKVGFGSILNIFIIGIFIDLLLGIKYIPEVTNFWIGLPLMIVGLFVLSLGSFFYIESGFGAGPRDSLMVALNRKTGIPVGYCRAAIEIVAVLIGWLLGGMVGAGTLIAAIGIGFCIQTTFNIMGFEPATVRHETVGQTFGAVHKKVFSRKIGDE